MAEAPGGPWNHAFVQTPAGHKIHYVHAGPESGLPVVLVHGWPDLWFGWRHQIKALAPTYRVLALDLRGFGQSSSPAEQSAYGAKNVTSDFVALLDALEIEKAVFIGHDWGGSMVWRMALHHPERVLGVSGICVPYVPPSEVYVEMDDLVKVMPMFAYWNYLMDVETSAPCLDTSPRRLFNVFYRRSNERLPLPNPDALVNLFKGVKDSTDPIYTRPATLLDSDEMDYYVDQYKKASFRGGCYYYGARKIDYEDERGLSPLLRMPALFIYADKDPVFNLKMAEHMPLVIPNLQIKCVADAGHFVLPEKPEEVNSLLLEWLAQLPRAS